MGKGSKRRPDVVSREKFISNWERAFKDTSDKKETKKERVKEGITRYFY